MYKYTVERRKIRSYSGRTGEIYEYTRKNCEIYNKSAGFHTRSDRDSNGFISVLYRFLPVFNNFRRGA